MSAKIMLDASKLSVEACTTAAEANIAAGVLGAGYGGAMSFTLSTTLPIITTSMTAILGILTIPYPTQVSPPTAVVRPENVMKINEDLASVTTLVSTATTESVASSGLPSVTFPDSVLDVTKALNDLSEFITENFVEKLSF